MDQTKRFVVFLLVTALVWFGWFGYIQPRFFPLPKKNPAAEAELAEAEEPGADEADAPPAVRPQGEAAPKPQLAKPENPRRTVMLGSEDPATGYFQLVTLDS